MPPLGSQDWGASPRSHEANIASVSGRVLLHLNIQTAAGITVDAN